MQVKSLRSLKKKMEVIKFGHSYQPNGWASKLRQEGSHAAAVLAGTVWIQ